MAVTKNSKKARKTPAKKISKKTINARSKRTKKPITRRRTKTNAKSGTSKKVKKESHKSLAIAIISFILNLSFFPGLGTIVGGRVMTGIIQIGIMLVSIALFFSIVGIVIAAPLMFGNWFWGIVIGVRFIKEAK